MDLGGGLAIVDVVARETMLVAAIGFLIGGLDDLIVDCVHFARRARDRIRARAEATLADLPRGEAPRRLAVFVAAWDESAVIGAMLRTALARFDHANYRLYVGVYPNDVATIAAVKAIARSDARVSMVIGTKPGPTTKADCLNTLWHALLDDQSREGRPFKGVVLHDAEDVVAAGELRIHNAMLDVADAVQTPVVPLIDPRSRWISAHYADEFAEAHGRHLPVRQAVGAGLPLAGVGCSIAVPMLARIAAAREGLPFDPVSLTEDYELGLTVAALGGRGIFVRMRERPGGALVATRAYFPATLDAAVRQKARWMVGIALAGWDRTGWHAGARLGDHWMRMRDRRTILAIPLLALAYVALCAWGVSMLGHLAAGIARPPVEGPVEALLITNAVMLGWRVALRAGFVARQYGRREGIRAIPRMVVGNVVALLAARRALWRYVAMLRGAELRWDKTQHHFPDPARVEGA